VARGGGGALWAISRGASGANRLKAERPANTPLYKLITLRAQITLPGTDCPGADARDEQFSLGDKLP